MWKDFLNLIFNNGCYACGQVLTRAEQGVCLHCLGQLEETDFHTNEKNNELYFRFAGKVPIAGAGSLFYFDKKGKIQKILHQLKYHEQHEIGHFLGQYWGNQWGKSPFFTDIDAIIPVPLHIKKEIQRGYNQSEKIAQGLSLETQIPVNTTILKRNRKTETQALKTKSERLQNVSNAFEVIAAPPQKILILDDVITTGSTIEACIEALMTSVSPSQSIKVACLAITRH